MTTTIEKKLQTCFRFLDLSRDVERNNDDTLLRDENGTIYYVFDPTVFEVFVNPRDHRGRSAGLHIAITPDEDAIEKSVFHYYASSIALLTAEYLASGALPGQKNGRLFMTQWHRWELARRVDSLRAQYEPALLQADTRKLKERIQRLTKLRERYATSLQDFPGSNDPLLHKDLDNLAHVPVDQGDVQTFIANRLAAQTLAEDDIVAPAEQVGRIHKVFLRRGISTLHLTFKPNEAQNRFISADAIEWFRRLIKECETRKIPVSKTSEKGARTEAALWDDAQSIALVRWVAVERMAAKERLAFVTADDVLFDVYRRWHAGLLPDAKEFNEPFFMRRLAQYAPVFNLADSRNLAGKNVRKHFESLRGVIEMTMGPVNLSQIKVEGQHAAEQQQDAPESLDVEAPQVPIARRRERTALRLLDKSPISQDANYETLAAQLQSQHHDELSAILSKWRLLERSSVGLTDQYIRERLSERERQLLGTTDADPGKSLERYVDYLIRSMQDGSIELWLPIAKDFIEHPPVAPKLPTRARVALRLEFDLGGDKIIKFGDALQRFAAGNLSQPMIPPDYWRELMRRPDLVFGMAAAIALMVEDWSNADHFVEMSLRPNLGGRGQDRDPQTYRKQLAELRYLGAMSKRLRIGSFGPPLFSDGITRVQRDYGAARERLGASIDYHRGDGTVAPQALRLLRALSERASLHLFFAAAMAPPVRAITIARRNVRLEGDRSGEFALPATIDKADLALPQEAWAALTAAESDLAQCKDYEELLPRQSGEREIFLNLLRRQFIPNIAAAAVLRAVLQPPQDRSRDREPPQISYRNPVIVEEIEHFYDNLPGDARPLLRAELLGFLTLAGNRHALGRLRELFHLRRQTSLKLDHALFDVIRAHFG